MQWVPRRLVLVVIFTYFEITILCFVVAIFVVLVHDVEAIRGLY